MGQLGTDSGGHTVSHTPHCGAKEGVGHAEFLVLMDPQRKVPRIHRVMLSLGSVVFISIMTFSMETLPVGRSGGVAHSCCTLRYSSIHPGGPDWVGAPGTRVRQRAPA